MLIGATLLQQLLMGVAVFVASLVASFVLLAILQTILMPNVATGLGYIRGLYPMFLTVGILWVSLAVVVRVLI
jgi:hypothetical protein